MAAWLGFTDHHDYGDEWQPREERPAPALVARPDRTATVRLLRPWAEATRHDCDHAEQMIDTLIAGSQDQAAALARQDAELVHLRSVVVHQTETILRQRKQLALARRAAQEALCAPEPPPLVLVALAALVCRAEALGERVNRAWAHEGWR